LVAGVVFLVLALVFWTLFSNAVPAFVNLDNNETTDLWSFLTGGVWRPNSEVFGIIPLLAGTLLVSLFASLIAIPIGIGATIYLSEIAHPRVKAVLKPAIEVLAGIPSVVLGLFGLLILAPYISDVFGIGSGTNALNGAIMLAIMMVPIMISLSEDAINAVPRNLREASFALGATRWETMRSVVLPAALSGIVASIILSIGRAVGETMVVLMVTGNSPQTTLNILDSVQAMTSAIAIDVGEVAGGSLHYHVLFALGVVLFIMTFVINLAADLIMAKYAEAYR
jgi:phosphate ABC transporter permease protein PstC